MGGASPLVIVTVILLLFFAAFIPGDSIFPWHSDCLLIIHIFAPSIVN
jgi:hypothetical protein